MEKHIIHLREVVGANCITQQDGQIIYRQIHPLLRAQQLVELDFADVNIVASPFLNAAVGQLLRDLTPDTLNSLLKFPNLPAIFKPILRRVIANAKDYYTNPERQRAINKVIAQRSEDFDAD